MAKNIGGTTEWILDLTAGRWKLMAIDWLLQGDRRFNQLQQDLKGIIQAAAHLETRRTFRQP